MLNLCCQGINESLGCCHTKLKLANEQQKKPREQAEKEEKREEEGGREVILHVVRAPAGFSEGVHKGLCGSQTELQLTRKRTREQRERRNKAGTKKEKGGKE